MSNFDQIWAGWRSGYVSSTHEPPAGGCVFCALLKADDEGAQRSETNIVWRSEDTVVILNAYPYGTGHLLVMPTRHVSQLEDLSSAESAGLWKAINDSGRAVSSAYRPDGMNIGFNLGAGAGAGIPDHLHGHVLPRWAGDTNFMTSIANARILPEPLDVTLQKLTDAWPASTPSSGELSL